MRNKYPHLLSGKELWAIHFEPLACLKLTPAEIEHELTPLTQLANKRRWEKAEVLQEALKDACQKKPEKLFNLAKNWQERINPKNPEEGAAAAGWIVLKHLHTARLAWKQFRRPYMGLKPPTPAKLRRAMNLALVFEKNYPKEERDYLRHLLALVLLLRRENTDFDALGREAIGRNSFTAAPNEKLLIVSHGMVKDQQWLRADLQTVSAMIKRLAQGLPPQDLQEIREWARATPTP